MIQEDKDLLLKDICSRIPYGVKCQCFDERTIATLTGVKTKSDLYFDELDWKEFDGIVKIDYCKPYLFPLSSMTEEQKEELDKYFDMDTKSLLDGYKNGLRCPHTYFIVQDWYNKNHFDYRGLIPMGLANDATGMKIY